VVGNISIVIEWENVLLSGDSRAETMLTNVIKQANDQPSCKEILISATTSQTTLQERPSTLRPDISWQLLSSPGSHYYALKNHGARVATGQIVVFIDSDVIPEPDWLSQILAPLENPKNAVSCGRAYIEPSCLYNKSFALFWFFPLRGRSQQKGSLDDWPETSHFFANNLAFRRDVAINNPFPTSEKSSRGACLELAESLQHKGIHIVLNKAALVAHPPPQPGEHFCLRALAQGRDRYLRSQGLSRTILGSCFRFILNTSRTLAKVLLLHRQVNLPLAEIPAACILGLTYYSLYWIGEVATIARVHKVLSITI
jgi:hypothetical protein